MEKDPQREIMIDPQWSILTDGLGYQVLLLGGVPGKDKDGTEIVDLVIKPDEIVRKRYKYKRDKELDVNGNVQLRVLKSDLITMNLYDDANRKWLYVKSFNGNETNISDREKDLKGQLVTKQKRILLLEADNIRLSEQLELAKTNPQKFIKQSAELFQEVAKGIAEVTRKDRE